MIDFKQYRDEYLKKLGSTNLYPPNSIFFSEAFAVYSLSKHYKIDMLVESGVFRGGSTSIWVKVLDDIQIRCFDILESERHVGIVNGVISKYKNNQNIEFTIGDGIVEIPNLVRNNKHLNIGVFVDGPKDRVGLNLCNNLLEYDNVKFACLHDYSALNDETHLSTKTNSEFIELVGSMNKSHPQIKKYPKGPGLYCIVK